MTLTISTICRSPWKKFIQWLLDVGVENTKKTVLIKKEKIDLLVYCLPRDLRIENILENILENI